MGELRFPGLATGIDTNAIIKQLMIANGRKLALYKVEKKKLETQNTELTKLRDTISAAKTAVGALSDADNLDTFSTNSSDTDILTVSASSTAKQGAHSIEINQLATTETWIQDTSTFDYKTDYVGGGNFIYSYNHKESVITAVENETTLQDMVNLINNDENNPGVTAGLLYQGGKYHLMLSGQESGEDYQISINTSSTEVWKPNTALSDHTFTDDSVNAGLSTKITELDQFIENGGLQGDEKITISGKNHFGTDLPNKELTITANTTVGHLINAINEQFDGVATATLVNGQIWLTDHISGSSGLEISLAYDDGTGDTVLNLPTMAVSTEGGATSESLASISSSSFIKTQDAQSSKIKVDGYPSSTAQEVQTLTLDSVATGGHFHLTYDGQTTAEIAYDATTAQVQAALEALPNVAEGDIMVGGTGLDTAGATTFTFLNTAGDVKMISIDDSALIGPSSSTFAETTKGNDGWLHRNSNSITNAITGVTLNLHDLTDADTPVKITINRNTEMISQKIRNMVTTYNKLMTELKSKTEYNAETKKMGILSSDFAVSTVKTQAALPFIGVVDGFVDTIDSFVQASDIGITIDGAGMMKFDQDDFNDAINGDFEAVLELLGATKSGNSSSNIVQFHNSSDLYTTAGSYHVKVTVADGQIDDNNPPEIKLSTESTYREAVSWTSDGVITFDNTFDDNGNPMYPECGLQLKVDLTKNGTYGTDENPVVIRVKQGIAGILEDMLDGVVKINGRLDVSKSILDGKITAMATRIKNEENRLDDVEKRLIEKFSRLEKTLSMMQRQSGAVNMVSTASFGS